MEEHITCPNCQSNNSQNSIFCLDCGFWLGDLQSSTRQNWETEINFKQQFALALSSAPSFELRHREYLLYFPNHKESLIFTQEQSIVLGRRTNSGVTGMHVVDLNQFEAAALGVSRHHAQITFRDDTYYLADLESSNGTFLNEERLHLGKQYPLKDGDLIVLAHLPIAFYCYTDQDSE